ncbi:DUF6090 family protein [Maribacter sp. HTCC2170]|uniref:DUF6090 family protein n=1 Tax=Maribacter sp. (strain HTCC2170 / KCCM 42371) TaxID=313603 RepID=UPI00006B4899|nr:DUF6090 family protein [Maribacter sp. HTCC2170]EAR01925.1 hypothetical protein FB2170_15393 [Maribacter sp. HTCC2170]
MKFFRKIRQKLLTESKFSKYMIYAVGEIILVVIGILIALAINNHNEENNNIEQEQVILKQLKTDYKANLLQLENKIEMRRKLISESLTVLDFTSKNISISQDSLSMIFATFFMDPTFDPIENDLMNLENIKLIRNDSLKQLLSHWTSDFNAYSESEQIQHDHYIYEIIPFMKEVGIMRNANHVFWKEKELRMGFLDKGKSDKILTMGKSPKEIDVQSILKDPRLEGLATFIFTFSQVCNIEGQTLKEKMQKTIEMLENEME